MKVYYLGPPGTFGEQAALAFARDASINPRRYMSPASTAQVGVLVTEQMTSHGNVIHAVESNIGDFGVVPVENSLEGAVADTTDALVNSKLIFATGEIVVPVQHHLIAAPGTRLEDIEVVTSHPQALGQCRQFLESRLPQARYDAALSTARAVKEASDPEISKGLIAGIGTELAAHHYNGIILARNIQDADNNMTRFLVLGREDAAPTGDDKTSLAFTVPDKPGAVVSVMQEFSRRGINLTRIESRPSRQKLGEYVFLLDFQGHRLDDGPAAALRAITEDVGARLLPAGRPLGSYPRFEG